MAREKLGPGRVEQMAPFDHPWDASSAAHTAFNEVSDSYNKDLKNELCVSGARVLELFMRFPGLFEDSMYQFLATLYIIKDAFQHRPVGSFQDPTLVDRYGSVHGSPPIKPISPVFPLLGVILFGALGYFLWSTPWAAEHAKTILKILVAEAAAIGGLLGYFLGDGFTKRGDVIKGGLIGAAVGEVLLYFVEKDLEGKLPTILIVEACLAALVFVFLTVKAGGAVAEYRKECKKSEEWRRGRKADSEVVLAQLRQRIADYKQIIIWIKTEKQWERYEDALYRIQKAMVVKDDGREKRTNKSTDEVLATVKGSASVLESSVDYYERLEKELSELYAKVK